ncbi:hypothetical protein [uncultured Alteromonas sp.]|jgi:hypothetical protein|uniref:hypothetical protein n=1 Tax=uncultured Alteromonas sp. TaxID=179113 RepID=UPI0030D1DA32|tara:strand:- start:11641 stop:12330 length:690 start_codon:yes stop_codon:yes gene_type:complete
MTPYLKSIYLNVGWQGEVNSVPETFHMDIDEGLRKRILALAHVRKQVDAESISIVVPDGIWSEFDIARSEGTSDKLKSGNVKDLLLQHAIKTCTTLLVIYDEGFSFTAKEDDADSEGLLLTPEIPFDELLNNNPLGSTHKYDLLYQLRNKAKYVNQAWSDRESIDWQEAEDLINLASGISKEILHSLPKIGLMLVHAQCEEDWDIELVGQWPNDIGTDITTYLQTVPQL